MNQTETNIISGISELSHLYDAAILDSWGVLHNGIEPYPGVINCLSQMRNAGWKTVVLSNAPRTGESVSEQVSEFGVSSGAYDSIINSGDLTRASLLSNNEQVNISLGPYFFHLGPSRDHGLLDGLKFVRVKELDECNFILNTGLYDDESEVAEDYFAFLSDAKDKSLPMVCANPDIQVNRGGRLIPCAGAIALLYEKLGGKVVYYGKPFPAVYEACLNKLPGISRNRVIAVGDNIATDIAGAEKVGIDALLVLGGIHSEELGFIDGKTLNRPLVESFLAEQGSKIVAAIPFLTW